MAKHRWLALFMTCVGLWVFFAPSTLPRLFASAAAGGVNDLAIWDQWIFGLAIMGMAASTMIAFRAWQMPTSLAVGVWLAASPSALGFHASAAPKWNALAEGILLAVPALWVLSHECGIWKFLADGAAASSLQLSMFLKTAARRPESMLGGRVRAIWRRAGHLTSLARIEIGKPLRQAIVFSTTRRRPNRDSDRFVVQDWTKLG